MTRDEELAEMERLQTVLDVLILQLKELSTTIGILLQVVRRLTNGPDFDFDYRTGMPPEP